jgi:hypothetical protein
MSKETLFAIGAGVLSAVSALAFLTRAPGSLIVVYLASLPLFMAGLAMGPRAVAIASAVGFMTAGLFGGAFIAGVFGLMQALPACLLAKQALLQRQVGTAGRTEWYSIGDALSWLTLLAAALLAMVAVTNIGSDRSFSGMVSDKLDYILHAMARHLSDGHRARTVAVMAPLFPGAVGGSWLIMSVINAALAQTILVRMKRNLRPTPAYAETTLPQWVSWPLVAAAALSLIGSGDLQYTGRNLTMVMAVPFFFVGLAVVHTLARRVAYKGLILAAFYLALVLSGWAMVAVACIGVIEQWFGLRHRFAGPTAGGSAGGPPTTAE